MTKDELIYLSELIAVVQHQTPLHVESFDVLLDSGNYVRVEWINGQYEAVKIDG